MKRPQGFDQPARRAAPAAERMPRPAASARATPPRAARAGAARTPSVADRFDTEPLVLEPRGTAAPHVAPDAPALAPDDGPRTAPAASAAAPADDRAARRELARAARRRRRYERQEVRRFTKATRRRRIVWGTVLGSLLVLVLGVAALAYSPAMALREVRVEGASRIPAAEVEAAFDDVLGTPLPLVTSEDVQEAIADFRLIETYRVETVPPGTLVLRIVERTPVGVVEDAAGLRLVDAAGVVIEEPSEVPEGQPRLEIEGGIASDAFRAAASVVRALPADLRAQLVRVAASSPDDVRLELASGARVQWGSAEASSQKAAVLASLMAAAPPDTVAEYDVSSPSTPVTR